jgi:hypothetical protein
MVPPAVTRVLWSKEDVQARDYIRKLMRKAGLQVRCGRPAALALIIWCASMRCQQPRLAVKSKIACVAVSWLNP